MILESIIISAGGIAIMAIVGYCFLKLAQGMVGNENRRTLLELQKAKQSDVAKMLTPVKLQAYERLIMFLERIKPENLVMRCYQYGMQTSLLKDVMIKNIRDEFDYNLSQQLYISEQSWAMCCKAKEETIALINAVSSSAGSKTLSPTDFSAIIFEKITASLSPIEQAQKFFKQELGQMQ
jgi:hypothetical protein